METTAGEVSSPGRSS